MSLGWLSEPAILPSQSKEIPIDQSSTRELAEAVFNKETEARQYGAVITNRQKITTLRNQQKQFIQNQNAAKRDEFIRQQNELKNKQRMHQKINTYDSIMKGDSNVVSNEYLVDFEGKGIDVITEDHSITLINARTKKDSIDYDLYEDMVIDSDEINKSKNKITFEQKMETYLQNRKQLIIDAKQRQQMYLEKIKSGNIDSLLNELSQMHSENAHKLRNKPIFTNRTVTKRKSTVHKNIEREIKKRKRKFSDKSDNENEKDNGDEPLNKKFKSKRNDKECDYATIPPPKGLYQSNDTKKRKESMKERMEINENKNNASELRFGKHFEQRQQTFVPNTAPQPHVYPQQTYPYPYYNPYQNMQGYNPYMNAYQNMQYPYPYYNPYMAQAPMPQTKANTTAANAKLNDKKTTKENE